MWALACGVVSSGYDGSLDRLPLVIVGVLLAGPLVCGTSQAVNDWFDRHVDAINEPNRPIPSGRIPGRLGLVIAIVWSILSLAVSTFLGVWGFAATVIGLALAWAYSMPPIRLKKNGWFGNAAVGACYEGLPWFTGALVMSTALPSHEVLALAALYSIGAHGIMTLNDFKSIEGDKRFGVNSLPVLLGPARAAGTACIVMAAPQIMVVGLLSYWGLTTAAMVVAAVLALQLLAMRRWLRDPRGLAPWYNGAGVTLFVAGMMACAVALAPDITP
jgi:chlorophyll synthase